MGKRARPATDWQRFGADAEAAPPKQQHQPRNEVKPWSERTPEERRAWTQYLQGKGPKPTGGGK